MKIRRITHPIIAKSITVPEFGDWGLVISYWVIRD
jgi:predicted membrane-bound spermidine synthase